MAGAISEWGQLSDDRRDRQTSASPQKKPVSPFHHSEAAERGYPPATSSCNTRRRRKLLWRLRLFCGVSEPHVEFCHRGDGDLSRYLSLSDIELVRVCAESNDSAAWEEFDRRFRRPITLSILRVAWLAGPAPLQLVDDLVQETYLKLWADKCRLLLDFATQHPDSIVGYIKIIAVNLARDHFKSASSQKRGAGQAAESLTEIEPSAEPGSFGGQVAMERQILLKQIDQILGMCTAGPEQERDCLIFWLHHQQGLSADAISALPGVDLSPKGVESVLYRLIRLVREQIVGARSQGPASTNEKGFRPAESY